MLNTILEKYGNDHSFLMDILIDVQEEFGFISKEAVAKIAAKLKLSVADVEETVSFYHFFTTTPTGKYTVYLNNSVTSNMMGRAEVADAFEKLVGCRFGNVSADGNIGLFDTACIGMNDQEPAALINGKVFTRLNRSMVEVLVKMMKEGRKVEDMISRHGDGNNRHPLVQAMVDNNLRREGPVIFTPYVAGKGLKSALNLQPRDVIEEVKKSNLRGRGGAGFPTGMKWDFCSREQGTRYVLCNADEGEPGTFKDRVLLTERPDMVFEGMAIAGYAIGSSQGLLYLRSEYRYLKAFLMDTLDKMRKEGILGKNAGGKQGFDFDIRIQFGSGAYVCGEESALIESAEGKRGEPRNRPPFPVQKGFMASPTIVNNVETFCDVVRIAENGGEWFTGFGTKDSAGTKLISISGDCKYPGVYEIEWGMSIREMLEMAGASDVQAVQVAGPSGICIAPSMFDRKIALEDLPTGGSMIIIGKDRDLIKDVVLNFMEFFMDESCGSCIPCRNINILLTQKVEQIAEGKAVMKDVEDMVAWANIMKKTTRCGLGQTSGNPVLTTVENFRELYEKRVKHGIEYVSYFDMAESVKDSCAFVGREPNLHE